MGLMREMGLIFHNLFRPVQPPAQRQTTHRQVKVEEKQVDEKVTLRRTTIEEVEITRPTSRP